MVRYRHLVCVILVLGFLIACDSLESASASAHLVVLKPVANMYSSSSRNSDVVSQAIFGTDLVVLKRKWGWAEVRTPDQYTGWIQKEDARARAKGEPPYASVGRSGRVESLMANLYREPDVTRHEPLMTLPYDALVAILSSSDGGKWLQIRLPDRRSAWVMAGDVSEGPLALTIDESVALAKRFTGVTYLWGGVTSFGFDCSGFTQMLIRRRGVIMPRDASPQAAWDGVAPVETADLKAGDLMFFGKDVDHIGHTGYYIGDGLFIHDTTFGQPGVQVSSLAEEPWKGTHVASRRLK